MATKLLYMDDFDVVTCTASVEEVKFMDDARSAIRLDQTCFYPRGGGQDWDAGIIKTTTGTFAVEEVRLDEQGNIWHIGEGNLAVGDQVTCQVSEDRRAVNTRLHSAGHVIDMVVSQLFPDWIPQKGAHYPHMSFVEYGAEAADESAQSNIQNLVNEILEQDITNTLRYVTKDELATLCRHVPENLPDNKPIRVVLYGDFGVPCGGTHVKKLSEIGKLEITKVKSKKGITKVSYRIEGIN